LAESDDFRVAFVKMSFNKYHASSI
jgi:hypothetical protein